MSQKVREYKNVTSVTYFTEDAEYKCGNCFNYEYPGTIHVVEKSALDKAVAALKYYADSDNIGQPFSGQVARVTLKQLGIEP